MKNKKIKYIKDFIKFLEKDCGKLECKPYRGKKDLNPHCPNCQWMWARGWLYDYLSTIKQDEE